MSLLGQYIAVVLLHRAERSPAEVLGGSAAAIARQVAKSAQVSIEPDEIMESLQMLEQFAAAELDFNPLTNGFWQINYDNFRYYFIESARDPDDNQEDYNGVRALTSAYPVLEAYARRGIPYAEDVIIHLRALDTFAWEHMRQQPDQPDGKAPAADRRVPLDHNSAAYKEIEEALDDAIQLASKTKPNDISGDEHASIISGLRAAREYWNSFQLTKIQVKVGILMVLEEAQRQLKITFAMSRGELLVEAIKAFFNSAAKADIF